MADMHDVPSNGLREALTVAAKDLPASMQTVYLQALDTVYDTVSNTVSDTVSPKEKEKEKYKEKEKCISSEQSETASEHPDADQSLMEFPCTGQLKIFHLRESLAATLREAFPELDRKSEYLKAKAWLESNPKKRKTARGMPRFLNAWFERAQNRGSFSGQVTTPSPEKVDVPYEEH
jgi:hypothetical protein